MENGKLRRAVFTTVLSTVLAGGIGYTLVSFWGLFQHRAWAEVKIATIEKEQDEVKKLLQDGFKEVNRRLDRLTDQR